MNLKSVTITMERGNRYWVFRAVQARFDDELIAGCGVWQGLGYVRQNCHWPSSIRKVLVFTITHTS